MGEISLHKLLPKHLSALVILTKLTQLPNIPRPRPLYYRFRVPFFRLWAIICFGFSFSSNPFRSGGCRLRLLWFRLPLRPPFFSPLLLRRTMDNSKCANDIDTPPAFATIIPAPETPSATARFKKIIKTSNNRLFSPKNPRTHQFQHISTGQMTQNRCQYRLQYLQNIPVT